MDSDSEPVSFLRSGLQDSESDSSALLVQYFLST